MLVLRRWVAGLVVLTAAVAGCAANADPNADPRCERDLGAVSLEVSEALGEAFCGNIEAPEMELLPLPNGGFGVRLSMNVNGMYPGDPPNCGDPEDPLLEVRAYVEGEQVAAEGGRCPLCGHSFLVFLGDDRESLLGKTATIELEVTDMCGRNASGSKSGVLSEGRDWPDAGPRQ